MSDDLPPFPARPDDGHKGTFGTVCVIGGRCSDHRIMLGGPALTALAALRAGCGLSILAMPEPLLQGGLSVALEATGIALPVDSRGRLKPAAVADVLDRYAASSRCFAVGPGLGDDDAIQQVMVRLIAQSEVPLVIDADGLNALSRVRDVRGDFRAQAVLTPHPGEFERLASALRIDVDATDPAAREDAARSMAQRLGCVVVLKGQRTVVSDGLQTWVNSTGNVALATAGSGDVLSGIIASLVAQFFKSHLGAGSNQITPGMQGGLGLFDCARLAVFMHGAAADLWARDHGIAGMLASDLLDLIPHARRDLEISRTDRAR